MFGRYYAVEVQAEPSFEDRFRYAGDQLEQLGRVAWRRHTLGSQRIQRIFIGEAYYT